MSFVGFVPEPNCGCGTIGILWNCLSTIALCAWSAQHWDFEDMNHSLNRTIDPLVAPEFAAWDALGHLHAALYILGSVRQFLGFEGWSLKKSFLVTDLGVKIRGDPPLSLNDMEVTFPAAIQLHGLKIEGFPDDRRIDGRSQKDAIGKTLVLMQTIWFLANVLDRLGHIRRGMELYISDGTAEDVISITAGVVIVIVRTVFLVQSFVVLRRAPEAIYAKTQWSSYWAHLGS
ncbi:hypothetical protein B0T26DRAFT_753503 [Lasiosphaeria miniovina]|uniref:Uncharacterized protein n=1 Tax=Lasiosphaeria miniovina TaxID=1954250 RepID=A0AA40DU67_9PEZI|nr:uncharacterized protein B0T26DRAFT_753503 [Lasiosphaeria miniovina]KAK0713391.1 hypothetical protein B0T26DRAFT_753503 [Lasiosphaeria miniovina]